MDYEGGTDKKLKIKNDNMEDQAFRQFLIDVYKAADHVMKPGAPFYIWHADSEGANFRGAAKDMGWQIREKKPSINDVHPTMKPVKLFGRLVKNSSKRNDIVLDLFGGSGTTIVACEQLNRRAYLMELDPAYVDVIIDRYQKLTNVEVMRSDGKLWNEL